MRVRRLPAVLVAALAAAVLFLWHRTDRPPTVTGQDVTLEDRVGQLEARTADLEARIAALESSWQPAPATPVPSASPATAAPTPDPRVASYRSDFSEVLQLLDERDRIIAQLDAAIRQAAETGARPPDPRGVAFKRLAEIDGRLTELIRRMTPPPHCFAAAHGALLKGLRADDHLDVVLLLDEARRQFDTAQC